VSTQEAEAALGGTVDVQVITAGPQEGRQQGGIVTAVGSVGMPGATGHGVTAAETWRQQRRDAIEQGREVPGLVGSQVGRACGDLRAEATRALRRAVGQRYADGTDRIRSALRAAAQEKDRERAEREAAVRHVMALLDRTAKTGR
jgi:hypothetical protein